MNEVNDVRSYVNGASDYNKHKYQVWDFWIKYKINNGFDCDLTKRVLRIKKTDGRLLEKYKKVDYLLIINDYNQDEPKVSLRSREMNLLDLNYTSGHELACGIDSEKIGNMKEFVKKLENKEIYELGYKVN